MNLLALREAGPADYQPIAELLNRAYRRIGANPNESVESISERAEDALVLVVERFGTIVGTLTAAPAGSYYGRIAKPGQMEVSRLAVHPKHQRQGVAKQMLNSVAAAARRQGVQALVGASLGTMRDAHRIYAAIGAEPIDIPGTTTRIFRLDLTKEKD